MLRYIVVSALFCGALCSASGNGMGFVVSQPNMLQPSRSIPALRQQRVYQHATTCQLNKVEEKSIQRMTKQFDKLCKTCPTRLQPRVDTITEMIVNLPESERLEIFAQVEERLKGGESGVAPEIMMEGRQPHMQDAPAKMDNAMSEESQDMDEDEKMMKKGKIKMGEMKMGELEKKRMKLEKKMEKNTMKLEKAKTKLRVIDSFTADGANDKPAATKTEEEMLMELRGMPEEEVAICRLKALEKVCKYERKLAECALKLDRCKDPAVVMA